MPVHEPTKEAIEAAEHALFRATFLARAARRVVEQAMPEDGDAGEDRVCITELLATLETEANDALDQIR